MDYFQWLQHKYPEDDHHLLLELNAYAPHHSQQFRLLCECVRSLWYKYECDSVRYVCGLGLLKSRQHEYDLGQHVYGQLLPSRLFRQCR